MLTAMLPIPAGSTISPAALRPLNKEVAPVAPPTPIEASTANLQYQRRPGPDPAPSYEPPSTGTTFAAAVLSGALTPTPQTLGELYARIGASDIPEGSQLRLRDLQV